MHKNFTRLERPARKKHSSLLQKFINYVHEKFIKLNTGYVVLVKLSYPLNYIIFVDYESRKLFSL
jgi:hypothetical protein